MKRSGRASHILQQIRTLPLSWLGLAQGTRLLIVVFSYGVGLAGLWLLFPRTLNGAPMFLPIISACWLFRYRGLLASMLLNGIAFQLAYVFLVRGLLPDQAFLVGGIIGFGTSLLLSLIVCWLRTAVDLVQTVRQRAFEAEQARVLFEEREQQALLAYEQQCQINAMKDQFLLNVSHELRTPLTVLGGYLDLLEVYHERWDPIKRTQMLHEARSGQAELFQLVDQMLDAARLVGDIPEAHTEIVHIHSLLQEVIGQMAPQEITAYTIHIQVSEQLVAWADPQFLRQVLRNLLSNIFKYVPRQTEIRIEAEQTTFCSPISLCVQDAGPGIPAEELPLLFERFVRLKRDLGGSVRGTGLGLYICRRLVEAMGGRIWVESSGCPGEGSRFCITLPVGRNSSF